MSEQATHHITVERAVPEDAVFLAEVQAQSWRDTYIKAGHDERNIEVNELSYAMQSDVRIENRITLILQAAANPEEELYLAAKDNEDLIGMLYGTSTSDKQEIQVLYVAKEAKQRGVGRALMEAYLKWSDSSRPVELGVIDDNIDAQEFYKCMGFKHVKDSARPFYDGSRLTEIAMVREATDL